MMDDLDDGEKNLVEANIAWLKNADPDDWHRAAVDFNWGEPLYVIDWIVQQTDCDIATAATVFWKGEPGAWLNEDVEDDEETNGFSYLNRKICAYIANRMATGGYQRAQIEYMPSPWTKKDYVDLLDRERSLTDPNFRTHPDLIRNRAGRRVEADQDFYRAIGRIFTTAPLSRRKTPLSPLN